MAWKAVLVLVLLASAQFYGQVYSVVQELQERDPGDPHYRRAVELLNEAIDKYESGDAGEAYRLLQEAWEEAERADRMMPDALQAALAITGSLLLGLCTPLASILTWYWTHRDWIVEEDET